METVKPFIIHQESFGFGELRGTTVRAILTIRQSPNEPKIDHPFMNVEILKRDALGTESWTEVQGEIRDYVCAKIAMRLYQTEKPALRDNSKEVESIRLPSTIAFEKLRDSFGNELPRNDVRGQFFSS